MNENNEFMMYRQNATTVVDSPRISINFRLLLRKLKSLWYVLVISTLVGGLCGSLYYGVFSKPKYQSSSMLYIRTSNKKLSLDSLQLTASLTQDYQIIFLSRPNLEATIKNLKLNYTIDQLSNMIQIENPSETRILKITVTSTNAKEAADIANYLMQTGMNDIREIDSQEPFLIEKGIQSNKRVGWGLIQYTAVAGFLALFISAEVIIFKFILSDSFNSSEEIEDYLGLPVLSVIYEDKNLEYAKLDEKKKRKHRKK